MTALTDFSLVERLNSECELLCIDFISGEHRGIAITGSGCQLREKKNNSGPIRGLIGCTVLLFELHFHRERADKLFGP